MDHQHTQPHPNRNRRPHARGDGPSTHAASPESKPQAPRTWGWTINTRSLTRIETAGPTHVGMDLGILRELRQDFRRPHARGDGPLRGEPPPDMRKQAPRTWGWTATGYTRQQVRRAGPTHVGMDRF